MKLGIQLHLAGLSLLNTVSILDVFGVSRARSTINNWVHKAELQPESGRTPDHVAVDETVIRLDDERYWLYAAVDPESNELLHTKLDPTRNTALALASPPNSVRSTTSMTPRFSSTAQHRYTKPAAADSLDFRSERHGNRNSAGRVFREGKRRTASFSNCFSHAGAATADEWLRSFAVASNLRI